MNHTTGKCIMVTVILLYLLWHRDLRHSGCCIQVSVGDFSLSKITLIIDTDAINTDLLMIKRVL